MSAGGLSYSALKSKPKTSLPSVSNWGTNMNILKDPPKSITTRRKIKVGDTAALTETIDDSGDRLYEVIQKFARGVNPSVSVSYSTHGNKGATQAKLPYRICKDGAFRPPIKRQEDLLPLSRQARTVTSAFTQKGFADFTKKLKKCGNAKQTKEVKNSIIKNSVTPNAVYSIQPSIEPFEIRYEIIENPINYSTKTNIADKTKYVNNTTVNTKPYTKEINEYNFTTNLTKNIGNTTSIDKFVDLDKFSRITKDIHNIDYNTSKNGISKIEYIHKDLDMQKNLPKYFTTTNIRDSSKFVNINHENEIIQKRNKPIANYTTRNMKDIKGTIDHSSRDYTLASKINPGGFTGKACKPIINKIHKLPQQQKNNISKFVLNEIFQRNGKPFPN